MSRAVFIVVTVFWVTMNVLLWQTEFGSRKTGGSVPVEVVWEKILTSADESSLTIYQQGRLMGACHLQTQVAEEWSQIGDENMPSGRPQKEHGYRLRLDGSAILPDVTNRVRFEGDLKFNGKREWQEVNARMSVRPMAWQVHSVAAEQSLRLMVQGDAAPFEVMLRFSDLRNPATLTYKLLGASAGDFASEAGLATVAGNASSLALGMKWDAHEDLLRFGRTPVQVYRLHTRLVDRYEVNIFVSRAGEILRVELPGDYRLVNDRLAAAGEVKTQSPKSKVE